MSIPTLLSHKQDDYKEEATKHWDIAPKCTNLDASIVELARVNIDEDETLTHDVPSGSGTPFACGSNDVEPNNDIGLHPFDEE